MRGNLCQATPSKTDVWCHPIVFQKFLSPKIATRKIVASEPPPRRGNKKLMINPRASLLNSSSFHFYQPTYLCCGGATHVQIIWLLTLKVAASSTSTSAWHGKAKQGEFKNHRKTLIATPKKSFRGQANLSRNILC